MTCGTRLCLGLTLALAAGCAPQEAPSTSGFRPAYGGIETILLDGDLVNFRVAMKGARNNEDVAAYGRCAAAQYALIRGFGFARHLRTNVSRAGDGWRGDAVYTISSALPRGLKTIDAEVTVRDCGEQGIPTV
ncbi:hypothetical protein RNZ50_14225 [Paracoccaceae bacterium Fryx2]|nr:hypothetical protein [Paracoccaceae bacterium Fryx2]